jgi:hypothetical protein
MNRKDFIRLTALAGSMYATSGIIKGSNLSGTLSTKDISAADVQNFLVSLTKLGPDTVDRFIRVQRSQKLVPAGCPTGKPVKRQSIQG